MSIAIESLGHNKTLIFYYLSVPSFDFIGVHCDKSYN